MRLSRVFEEVAELAEAIKSSKSGNKSIISLRNVSKHYGSGNNEVVALDSVSFDVREGEFVSITGPSGSGKSTVMNILGCLDIPDDGEYFLCGRDAAAMRESELCGVRNRMIGFIFQSFNLIPTLTALENVELPLIYRHIERTKRRRMASDALRAVGLAGRMKHLPCEMSGGQCQRVAIARAIAARPKLLLADEPTGNLDSAASGDIMRILRELWNEGHTVVLITHDQAMAAGTERIISIRDGHVTA